MRFERSRHRGVPALNATSMADISFMLLVFFLMTSSMDADQGLARRLPPPERPLEEQQDVSRSNVLQLRIDDDDQVYCDGRRVAPDELQRQVESFLMSRMTDRYTIDVETGRHTSYNAYFELQNTIVAAYRQTGRQPIRIREVAKAND